MMVASGTDILSARNRLRKIDAPVPSSVQRNSDKPMQADAVKASMTYQALLSQKLAQRREALAPDSSDDASEAESDSTEF
jgi:hypothetical protein